MYEPIAIFDYDNKKYGIVTVDETILFFKHEDGKIQVDLNEEEIELVYSVFNSLKVDEKNSINLGIKRINNKDFEILYDINTKLYFWYQIVDGNRYYSTNDDSILLNFMYNNMNFVSYEGEIYDWKEEEIKKKRQESARRKQSIKRVIRCGGKTLIVAIAAIAIYSNLTDKNLAEVVHRQIRQVPKAEYARGVDQYNEIDKLFEEYASRPYNFEEINNAIDNNSNLSDDEKQFLGNLKFYFDENHQYMDIDEIIERLKRLKIFYEPNECENNSIVGEYSYEDGNIVMYNSSDFDTCNKLILLHELMHVTQQCYSSNISSELSNELTSREAARRLNEMNLMPDSDRLKNSLGKDTKYGNGYDPCMSVEYLLANTLDKEDLIKFQCVTDEEILINALEKIDSQGENHEYLSEEEQVMRYRASSLLSSINNLASRDENGHFIIEYTKDNYDSIYDQINYYYQKKYGMPMKESLSANIVNYDITYNNWRPDTPEYAATLAIMKEEAEKQTHDEFAGFGEYKYVLPKTYFSDAHANPIIMFNSPKYVEVEITPEIEGRYRESYSYMTVDNEKSNNADERE